MVYPQQQSSRTSHSGVRGNRRADGPASTADITSGLQLVRADVLGVLRDFLNVNRSQHHSIHRLKERGEEKGSGRRSTVRDRELSVSATPALELFRGQPWGDC